MTMIEKMNQAEEYVLHTYNRFPVVFEKGEGVCLYDTEGKEYLDFAAGIAVNALGYHYPGYDEALKAQIDKLLHVSNLYYNVPIAEAGEKLVKASGLEKVFFTNSGTEAIEGALKAAKKYAYIRDGHSGHEIIAMNHSFHGRTIGALSVTGNAHYRDPFAPLMDGVKFADFNDINSVKEKITEKTCAILLEPVQGEGGIFPAEQEALGCGVPVGAFVLGKKAAKASLAPGDHGTTYGGNPFVCAAVSRVFDIFEKDEILKHVQEHILFLEDALDRLAANHDCVLERRGMGFMQGLVLKKEYPVGEVVKKALDEDFL